MRSRQGGVSSALPLSSPRRPLAMVFGACLSLFLALGAGLVTSVISAAPASAHAVLIKITPAANGHLTSAPTNVVLTFDDPISSKFATVVVTSAAGVSVAQGKPTVLGGKVTQALSPSMASGAYRVAYRVTSADGHPVSGQSTFTLTLPPGSGPTATPTTASGAASATPPIAVAAAPAGQDQNASQGSWLSRYLVPVSGAFGLLVVGLGVLAWERRRH
jgi:methionine-rich copper-binding protein CopC